MPTERPLADYVHEIEGLTCWHLSTGGAVGSTFQLALGKKVPRRLPLKNPAATDEYRHFEGEQNLLVWCAWRLDDANTPLVSWDQPDERVQTLLGKVVGATIASASIVAPAWDLTVSFSNGLLLRVFCDHVPGDPSINSNWEIWRQDHGICVGLAGEWHLEPRAKAHVPSASSSS